MNKQVPEHPDAVDDMIADHPPATPEPFDSLLSSLEFIAGQLGVPFSRAGATTGLPLKDGRLTVDLFERAATRMGLKSRVVRKRPNRVAPIAVPFIALLQDDEAAIVTSINPKSKMLSVVFPSAPNLIREVESKWLAKRAINHVILVSKQPSQHHSEAGHRHSEHVDGHWLWGTILSFWPSLAHVALAAFIINLLALATPLFIMNVYDRVVPNLAIPTLWALAAGVVIALVFDLLLRQIRSVVLDWTGRRVDMSVASRIFEHALFLKSADRTLSAGALANSIREFEVIREFFTSASLIAIIDLAFIGVFLAVIWYLAGPLCLVPIFTVACVFVLTLVFQLPIGRSVAVSMAEASQRHAILVESLVGIDSIKAAAAEGSMQRRWEAAIAATARANSRSRFWSSWITNLTNFLQQSSTIIVIIWGVFLIAEGSLTVGALIATSILTSRVLGPLAGIATTLARAHQAMTAVRDLTRIMQLPSERQVAGSVATPVSDTTIEFKAVNFRYPAVDTDTLTDVSFRIGQGERVGIVGRVGSGKSTLGRLLAGFYRAQDGNVMLGGQDLRSYDVADLRATIGYVPQEPELFTGTVYDNISMGTAAPDAAKVAHIAKLTGVAAFTSINPKGLDMAVGERGRALSGGQRQAVALARILLREPKVLFLDESSSAMDTITEAQLCTALSGWANADKTLIVATHRGSMLSLVSRLIVIDAGKIVADGPKADVLKYLQKLGAQNKAKTQQEATP